MPSQNPNQNSSVWGKLLEMAQAAPSQPVAPNVPPGTFQVPPPVIDPFAVPVPEVPPAPAQPRGPRLDPDKVRRFQDSFRKAL